MTLPPAGPAPPQAVIRILALGDSYTIGEGVAESERWPSRLAAMLRAQARGVAEPDIVARTGWTTDELSAGIDAARPPASYDLVTLLIGVNNEFRGRSAEEYRVQFRQLLACAIGFAGGRAARVIVVAIPDWSVTPFANGRDRARIAREIDEFNAINHAESDRAGAHYADISTASRRAGTDASLLTRDGLHPSGALYLEWARLILPVALTALQS
jgi:lysophospholipase L1-like esterase